MNAFEVPVEPKAAAGRQEAPELGVSGTFGITFESSLDDTRISEKQPELVMKKKKVKSKKNKVPKKKKPVQEQSVDIT